MFWKNKFALYDSQSQSSAQSSANYSDSVISQDFRFPQFSIGISCRFIPWKINVDTLLSVWMSSLNSLVTFGTTGSESKLLAYHTRKTTIYCSSRFHSCMSHLFLSHNSTFSGHKTCFTSWNNLWLKWLMLLASIGRLVHSRDW